jgi:hypothetical protein
MKRRVKITVELDDNQEGNAEYWLTICKTFLTDYDGRARLKVQVGNEVERYETDKAKQAGA